jgi:hypothetical protein
VAADEPGDPRARSGRAGDYRAARIGAAAAFITSLVVIILADVVVESYELQPLIVAMLLGAVGGLLGVELLAALKGLIK